jgi:transcriptional regulator with XRE-family HTH domain
MAGVVTVGAGIAAARTAAGLGQRRLAQLTGITQPTLSRIEHDEREAKVNELAILAWALGCTISELTGRSPVRDRAVCAARSGDGTDMESMQLELLHYLELDAYLDEQGIAVPA